MHRRYKIKGLFISKPVDLKGTPTSICKNAVEKLQVLQDCIDENQVADVKHHGGEMRVIHHYSGKNYQALQAAFPEIQARFTPGSFGENLYTDELDESELCVGDIFQAGSTKLQVTVPRRPCAKLNLTYDDNRILKEVVKSFHVGWFFKVLTPGEITLGDELHHLDRPYPQLKLFDLMEQGYGKDPFHNIKFLQDCLNTELMDKGWKPQLEFVLSRHKI